MELPAFPTAAGWDMATGIGSINIANLVNNWQNVAGGGVLYTPSITVTATSSSYTYGLPPASVMYTAAVSGPGSFPTGSVNFSGSTPISTIGTDPLAGSTGCTTGSTCTEVRGSGLYAPPGTLPGGSYTITGNYLSTNESYMSGSGTTTLTVNPQAPTVTVTALSIPFGTASANFSANVAYTGSGVTPSGGLTFKVDSEERGHRDLLRFVSPITCTFDRL